MFIWRHITGIPCCVCETVCVDIYGVYISVYVFSYKCLHCTCMYAYVYAHVCGGGGEDMHMVCVCVCVCVCYGHTKHSPQRWILKYWAVRGAGRATGRWMVLRKVRHSHHPGNCPAL